MDLSRSDLRRQGQLVLHRQSSSPRLPLEEWMPVVPRGSLPALRQHDQGLTWLLVAELAPAEPIW
jgi:hypothetical protein